MCCVQVREPSRNNRHDMHMQAGLPCVATILWTHNHGVETAAALSYRPSDMAMKQQFLQYFDDGLSPAGAMQYHRQSLEMSADFQEQNAADGSLNPSARSVYYWHHNWRQTNLGTYILCTVCYTCLLSFS